jgi:hypothetical protein
LDIGTEMRGVVNRFGFAARISYFHGFFTNWGEPDAGSMAHSIEVQIGGDLVYPCAE